MSFASRIELTQGQASNLQSLIAASLALGVIPSVPEKSLVSKTLRTQLRSGKRSTCVNILKSECAQ
jgi:hypothetical protein